MAQMGYNSVYGEPDCEDLGGVKYAEYALFHEHQVLPRYIVKFSIVSQRLGVIAAANVPGSVRWVRRKEGWVQDRQGS